MFNGDPATDSPRSIILAYIGAALIIVVLLFIVWHFMGSGHTIEVVLPLVWLPVP